MAVCGLFELTEKAVVDDAGKECILKESHSVNELDLLACYLKSVSSHSNICEDRSEVRLDDLIEKLGVCVCIKVFYENDLVRILTIKQG